MTSPVRAARLAAVPFAALLGLASCISIVSHDEQLAAKAATSFAEAAFVDQDFAKAHAMLAPTTAARFDLKAFGETIASMHPESSYPARVIATDFETIPGQQAMFIDVEGEGQQHFFYRFAVDGDAKSGYKIADFVRTGQPNPSKAKQSLIFRPGQAEQHSEGDGHQH